MMSRGIVISARPVKSCFPWGKVTTTAKVSRATEGHRVNTANSESSARATPEAEPSNVTRMMRSRMRFGK